MIRYIFIMSLMLILSNCGFKPLYSSNNLDKAVAKISVSPIDGVLGQTMRSNLEHIFNPNNIHEEKEYRLIVTLKEQQVSTQGITQDDFATRITISLTANYKLMKGNKVILQDKSMSLGSYNILNNPYSSYVSQNDMLKQLNDFISNDIALRVSIFIKDYKEGDTIGIVGKKKKNEDDNPMATVTKKYKISSPNNDDEEGE